MSDEQQGNQVISGNNNNADFSKSEVPRTLYNTVLDGKCSFNDVDELGNIKHVKTRPKLKPLNITNISVGTSDDVDNANTVLDRGNKGPDDVGGTKGPDVLDRLASSGIVSVALVLGRKVGLIDCLCKKLTGPETIDGIAKMTNLKPRYVQEWLGAMVAANIVTIYSDGSVNRYAVDDGIKDKLKMASLMALAIPMFMKRQERVEQCFRSDGPDGFSYSEETDAFDYMTQLRKYNVVKLCEDDILPAIRSLHSHLEDGCWALDVGCGTGDIILTLAKKYPHSSFIGVDTCKTALQRAQVNVVRGHTNNVTLQEGDAQDLPRTWVGCFDWVIMYDVLHDLPNPRKALKEIWRVLKKDGVLSLVEIGLSCKHENNIGDMTASSSYVFSMYCCLPCSLCDGAANKNPGMGVENMQMMLKETKFDVENFTRCSADEENVHFVCRKMDIIE